jgi:hypothetical protein
MVFTHSKALGHKLYLMGFTEIRVYVWLCLAWFLVLGYSTTWASPKTIIPLTLISERDI